MTMGAPCIDIANRLDDQGLGTIAATSGWAIAYSREPINPVQAITVYDTGGTAPDTDQMDIYRPTFLVRVRAKRYADAYAKAQAIRDDLINMAPITINGSIYVDVTMTGEIISIGRDDNDRQVLTANYQAIREGA